MTQDTLSPLPSVEQYKQAFEFIRGSLSEGRIAMLRAQFLAPDHTLTATELAKAAGYKNFRGTNLQYGLLGAELRHILGYQGDGQESYILSSFYPPETEDEDWLFIMHPNVVQALDELGWFDHWEL